MSRAVSSLPSASLHGPASSARYWRAFAVVALCLYVPFGAIYSGPDFGSDYWFFWLKLWPVLPGFLPGALLFHPHDAIEFTAMGVFTLVFLGALTWLGSRGPRRLALAAAIALAISIPSACFAYAAFVA